MHNPPFLPGDRVRVNERGRETASAPKTTGLLYVAACRAHSDPASTIFGDRKSNWSVAIVGKPGFRTRRGERTGFYNARFFDLVCRDPAQSASR